MLNYRHLYYFWSRRQGRRLRARAERLDMAIQTIISAGQGARAELGPPAAQAGRPRRGGHRRRPAVLARAERSSGSASASARGRSRRFGPDGAARGRHVRRPAQARGARAALPVLDTPGLKLLCHEAKVDDLLAELALHRLDVVLACQPAPQNSNPPEQRAPDGVARALVRAVDAGAQGADRRLPASLGIAAAAAADHDAAMRGRIDRWFESQDIRPRIVGEFEDSALLSRSPRKAGVFFR